MADVRKRDVEAVARWLYDTCGRIRPGALISTWAGASEPMKDVYRDLARELLADPPLSLRRRVRELEGE